MDLMLITNSPDYAKYAEDCGVDIIFIDLEVDGKLDRQGHLDTVISSHSLSDIALIKTALRKSKVLVRINPYNKEKTVYEVEEAVKGGADMIMLPMFKTAEEIVAVNKIIAGRCIFIPLLETSEAVESLDSILKENVLTHIHIGLNDLHLSYKLEHMFALFSNGIIDKLITKLRAHGINYGVGGVAAMEEGDIQGKTVLNKYYSMGAKRVILSRSFHHSYSQKLHIEVAKLRDVINTFEYSNINQYEASFKESLKSL